MWLWINRVMPQATPVMGVVTILSRQVLSTMAVAGIILPLVLLDKTSDISTETQHLRPDVTQSSDDFKVPVLELTFSPEILGKDKTMGVLDDYAAQGKKRNTAYSNPALYTKPGQVSKPAGPVAPKALSNPALYTKPAPAPAPLAPRKAAVPSTGGGGGLGTSSTGAVSGFAGETAGGYAPEEAAAPAAPRMTDEEFLAQDSEYNDTKTGAETEYQNLIAQLAKQKSDYQLDNNNTLRNLGWQDQDAEGPNPGRWNQQDKLTGYGQAFQNQLGDFSSRGMLDSSLYGGALNDLNRGFEQQRGDLGTALQNFNNGQQTDIAGAGNSRDQAVTSAQRQALARMAAQLGL